ncbi:MAG: cytochrome b [Pseudomonadota bacterium]
MRYSLTQRMLHWGIAAIVIGALAVGTLIGQFGFQGLVDTFGQSTTNLIYKYHKTFGVIILFAMVIRLLVRLQKGKPTYDPPISDFEAKASRAAHGLLYVCLFLMPIFGWLGTGAGGFPVEFFNWTLPGILSKDKALSDLLYQAHAITGWVLLGLIVIHIGAALKHTFVNKDTVLRRML